jgi:uncharacterized membrane protein YcaP (DUF421 family)
VDSVLRAAITYFVVWLFFRIAGKRTLGEVTTFDFVTLLIISETTQAGLIDEDHSLTNSILLIVTFLGLDITLSLWKQRSQKVEKLLDGVPLVIVAEGVPIKERMDKERIDEEDVISAARELRGLERLDQVKYAILERNGCISIIPKEGAGLSA